jgi:hypothetical protein
MSTIMKTQKTLVEKLMFALSIALFGLLNLVPGLITRGSYAEAQYGGGGGGGSCSGCPGGATLCCSTTVTVCQPGQPAVCASETRYYHKK